MIKINMKTTMVTYREILKDHFHLDFMLIVLSVKNKDLQLKYGVENTTPPNFSRKIIIFVIVKTNYLHAN